MKTAKKFIEIALGGNMYIATLRLKFWEEMLEDYAKYYHKNIDQAGAMPNKVLAGDIDIKSLFGGDIIKYSLWCEIVNDIYMEYDDTSDASKAKELMYKIEKLLKLVSQHEA